MNSVDPTSPRRQSQHEQRRQSSCQLLSRARSRYLSVIGRRHPAHSSALTVAPSTVAADDGEVAAAGDIARVDVTAASVSAGDAIALSVIAVGDFKAATDSRHLSLIHI